MENDYLFVYGTLKSSYDQNPIKFEFTKNTQFISKAFVFGDLYLVADYPGVILGGNEKVWGEVYQIQEIFWPVLDKYEDYYEKKSENSLYIRKQTDAHFDNDLMKKVWIYSYNKSIINKKRIISGFF